MKKNFKAHLILVLSLLCVGTVDALPPALQNCGNTCFLNASIQALYNIAPLTELLLAQPTNPYLQATDPVPYYYWELIKKFDETKNPTAAVPFTCQAGEGLKELDEKSYDLIDFACGSQQDATDFIWKFLNELINKTTNQQLQSTINKLFEFTLPSTIKCPAISDPIPLDPFESTSKDPALHLAVETKKNQTNFNSLDQCLENYFSVEKLDEYTDPLIEIKRSDCTKQLSMESSPEILIISLKRFEFISPIQSKKLDHTITIPLNLNIAQFIKNGQRNPNQHAYDLIGVVVQSGGTIGGHYWAYVRDLSNQWYNCNDSNITKVNYSAAQKEIDGSPDKQTGYLLVYQKTSSRKTMQTKYKKKQEREEQERVKRERERAQLSNLVNDLQKLQGQLRQLEQDLGKL